MTERVVFVGSPWRHLGWALLCGSVGLASSCSSGTGSDSADGSSGAGGAAGESGGVGGRSAAPGLPDAGSSIEGGMAGEESAGGASGKQPAAGASAAGDAGSASEAAGAAGGAGAPSSGGCDEVCTGDTPICDAASQTCVECSPDDDTCPATGGCSEDASCEGGCSSEADCSIGACSVNQDCEVCFSDDECASGKHCGSGACSGACDEGDAEACSGGFSCCDGVCVDAGGSVAHCGGCGVACGGAEFCGTEGCTALVLANVCSARSITGMLDGGDDETTRSAVAALEGVCDPAPQSEEESQSSGVVLDVETGKPIVFGGELLVASGGGAVQWVVDYLELAGVAPVYLDIEFDGNLEYRRTDTDEAIVSHPFADTGDTHDFVAVELLRDPDTGTPVLIMYGAHSAGTVAATWFFIHRVLEGLADFQESWYIFEWTDSDATPGASEGDEFVTVASGG